MFRKKRRTLSLGMTALFCTGIPQSSASKSILMKERETQKYTLERCRHAEIPYLEQPRKLAVSVRHVCSTPRRS